MKYSDKGYPVIERVLKEDEILRTADGRVFSEFELTEEEFETMKREILYDFAGGLIVCCAECDEYSYLPALITSDEKFEEAILDNTLSLMRDIIGNNMEMIIELAARRAMEETAGNRIMEDEDV